MIEHCYATGYFQHVEAGEPPRPVVNVSFGTPEGTVITGLALVDTGSQRTVLNRSYGEPFRLGRTVTAYGVNGTSYVYVVEGVIRIGKLVYSGEFILGDTGREPITTFGFSIIGIIGMDVIGRVDLRMNASKAELRFLQA